MFNECKSLFLGIINFLYGYINHVSVQLIIKLKKTKQKRNVVNIS